MTEYTLKVSQLAADLLPLYFACSSPFDRSNSLKLIDPAMGTTVASDRLRDRLTIMNQLPCSCVHVDQIFIYYLYLHHNFIRIVLYDAKDNCLHCAFKFSLAHMAQPQMESHVCVIQLEA